MEDDKNGFEPERHVRLLKLTEAGKGRMPDLPGSLVIQPKNKMKMVSKQGWNNTSVGNRSTIMDIRDNVQSPSSSATTISRQCPNLFPNYDHLAHKSWEFVDQVTSDSPAVTVQDSATSHPPMATKIATGGQVQCKVPSDIEGVRRHQEADDMKAPILRNPLGAPCDADRLNSLANSAHNKKTRKWKRRKSKTKLPSPSPLQRSKIPESREQHKAAIRERSHRKRSSTKYREHLAKMESKLKGEPPAGQINTSKQKGGQMENATECEINLGTQEAVGFYTPMIRKA